MIGRRRWALRLRGEQAQERALVVEVPADRGSVVLALGGGAALELEPADVSRLRRVLLDAQARALLDRGTW